MVFSFDSQYLKDICENEHKALEALNSEVIFDLQACLSDIEAAKNLGDLPEVLWKKPKKNQDGTLVASFILGSEDVQLFFTQNHTSRRQINIDSSWCNVSRIRLLYINYKNEII